MNTNSARQWLNRHLARGNLRLETLTRERAEASRLETLRSNQLFDQPYFPVPACMRDATYRGVLAAVDKHAERFRSFRTVATNEVGYTFDNDYYSSPDAEVLYACVREFAPKRIVEIGCGNSTKLSRMAVRDGGLDTRIVCIDPQPRSEILALCDEAIPAAVETELGTRVLDGLQNGDLLFIDSSHEARAGNDVLLLFLKVIPRLPSGVLVHVHDIFLPYEYPADWIIGQQREFHEQYLLQAMLQDSSRFEVLWPGYYLQRTLPDFKEHFEHLGQRRAQSFWFRIR